MKIIFIQLSDIHFSESSNHILDKSEQLFNAISNNTLGVSKIFLLITGDIAFSGKEEEYKIANSFITELILKIEIYSKISVDIIIIPGNHDCDFSKGNKARENMIKIVQSSGETVIDESVINILTEPQSAYFTFFDQLILKENLAYKNKLLNVFKFELEEKTIIINCFNSSYDSQLHEKPGQMLIPINSLGYDISVEKANLIITTFHHPLHWLNPDNKREFKNIVESISDVYITGHEHQISKSLITDLENNSTIYIEGNVAQDSHEPNNSGFNLLLFDLGNHKFQISNYQWDTNIYINSASNKWISYERGISKANSPFDLNKDFKSSLNDIGANLSHPNVSKVNLLDIYTFPRLEYIIYQEDDIKNRNRYDLDSESLIATLEHPIRIALTGPENIGKSSLLKILFLKLHSIGLVPVLIEGKRIDKTGIDDFRKNALDNYCKQYNSVNNEYFLQLSKSKIVVLIDNFDKASFNKKYKGRLLSNLLEYYDNIIVTGNELMSLEDLLNADKLERVGKLKKVESRANFVSTKMQRHDQTVFETDRLSMGRNFAFFQSQTQAKP